jgi:stage II sporulation protein M
MQLATEAFKYLVDDFRPRRWVTIPSILLHNVMASILILISGVLIGIIPTFAIGSNGFFLGVVYRQTAEVAGYRCAESATHGVFELPALLIAASYGLWPGVTVVRRMRGQGKHALRFHLEHAFRRYLTVVFPLLLVAVGIELAPCSVGRG